MKVHSCCSHLDQRVGDLVVDLSCVCRGVVASEEKCSDGTLLCLLPVKHEGDGLPGAPVLFAGGAEEGHLVVDLVNVKNVFGLFLGEEITIVRPTSVTCHLDLSDVEGSGPHHHLDPLGLRLAPVDSHRLDSGAVTAWRVRSSQ